VQGEDVDRLQVKGKDDVLNAGGTYVYKAVVRDGNGITSRVPNDLPVCTATISSLFETAKIARDCRT